MVNTQIAVEINNSSIEELREINELIQMRKDMLGKNKMRELKVGDKVSFEKKNGVIVNGTIRKKNIKRIVVDTPEGGWNVPANMLTLVEEWDD
jgi:putative ribosome biogenesis GTPase RsgA